MVVLYGISNCDTVKKARKFLEQQAVEFQFHDFRKDGLETKQVTRWIKDLGLDIVVNKRSRTWKELSEKQQALLQSAKAADLIVDNPTLIKRPLLAIGENTSSLKHYVGFDPKQYLALFS